MERISHLVVALGFLAFLISIPGSRAGLAKARAVAAQWPSSLAEASQPPDSFAFPEPFGGDESLSPDEGIMGRLDTLLSRLSDLSRRAREMGGGSSQAFSVLLGDMGQRVLQMRNQLQGLDGSEEALDHFLDGMSAALEMMEQAMDEAQFRMELDSQIWT